jgi:hypothetical protein
VLELLRKQFKIEPKVMYPKGRGRNVTIDVGQITGSPEVFAKKEEGSKKEESGC